MFDFIAINVFEFTCDLVSPKGASLSGRAFIGLPLFEFMQELNFPRALCEKDRVL